MKSFLSFISEDIELIPLSRPKTPPPMKSVEDLHTEYSEPEEVGEKIVVKRKLGEMHPGYDLYQHSRLVPSSSAKWSTNSASKQVLQHRFTIVHRQSGKVAGEMRGWGGRLHPIRGVMTGAKGKGIKEYSLNIHPDHSSKKVGVSLPVEMYRFLHRRGHAIQSDTMHSQGGANVWDTMRNDTELGKHMMVHDRREPLRGEMHTFTKKAARLPQEDIWHQYVDFEGPKVKGKKVEDEPEIARTLILSGKKRRKARR